MNQPELVRPPLRQRVSDAARELRYVPNPAARALARRRTMRIGAVIPTVDNTIFSQFITAVTRRMLVEFLWQPEWDGVTNVIEVHINRLRNKLSNGGIDPQLIFTQRGSGYIMRWDPDAPPPPPPPPEELTDPSSDPDV